jgi:hypothetical protein
MEKLPQLAIKCVEKMTQYNRGIAGELDGKTARVEHKVPRRNLL